VPRGGHGVIIQAARLAERFNTGSHASFVNERQSLSEPRYGQLRLDDEHPARSLRGSIDLADVDKIRREGAERRL
jgi:hypothetical protein